MGVGHRGRIPILATTQSFVRQVEERLDCDGSSGDGVGMTVIGEPGSSAGVGREVILDSGGLNVPIGLGAVLFDHGIVAGF